MPTSWNHTEVSAHCCHGKRCGEFVNFIVRPCIHLQHWSSNGHYSKWYIISEYMHYLIKSIQTSLCSNKLKPRCHYDHSYLYKRRQKAVCCSMGRSGELSDFERGLVIGCHISKKSVRDIATSFPSRWFVTWLWSGKLKAQPQRNHYQVGRV
jgi:hypothetical protein